MNDKPDILDVTEWSKNRRDEIAKIIYGEHHLNDITWQNCRPKADSILALIAHELEKARRFDGLNHADSIDAFVETFPEIQEWKEKARKYDAIEKSASEDEWSMIVMKAGKWDRVKEIAETCMGCEMDDCGDGSCSLIKNVDAIEGDK